MARRIIRSLVNPGSISVGGTATVGPILVSEVLQGPSIIGVVVGTNGTTAWTKLSVYSPFT